jgi:hypothetical protein
MFFSFPEGARWNADRQALEFGVEIGEYSGVVRVPWRVFQRLQALLNPSRRVSKHASQALSQQPLHGFLRARIFLNLPGIPHAGGLPGARLEPRRLRSFAVITIKRVLTWLINCGPSVL